MTKITYEAGEKQADTVSVFLMTVLEYARETKVFEHLEAVKVAMKTVVYSPLQKAQSILASIVMGCEHTKAMNEVLGAELPAARYLDMERFPDQSQINRYLTRFNAENIEQLRQVQAQVFMQHSRARQAKGMIVVDFDQTGLTTSGKTYELARKGYFPRKRGEKGYQLSAAYIGAYNEAVQLYLDPGDTPCIRRLPDLLRTVDQLVAADNPGVTVVRRLDAGYDSAANRQLLLQAPGYFIMKSAEDHDAHRLAQRFRAQDWLPLTDTVYALELPVPGEVRYLLYEFWAPDGRTTYMILQTNLPADQFGLAWCLDFYNDRQTIEAFFKQARHVHHIHNLRSRQFFAIYAFLLFLFLAHNLIHWTQAARFAQTELDSATTGLLVRQLTTVRAYVDPERWHLLLIGASRWATLLLQVLQPHPIQLLLPFACLHKT